MNSFQVRRNDSGWRNWFDKDAPEENTIPDGYETSLDTFRKLLLVRLVPTKNGDIFEQNERLSVDNI